MQDFVKAIQWHPPVSPSHRALSKNWQSHESHIACGSSGGPEGKLAQEQAARLRPILATCDVPNVQTPVEKAKVFLKQLVSISHKWGIYKKTGANLFEIKRCTFVGCSHILH
jgi:hypothetical protein